MILNSVFNLLHKPCYKTEENRWTKNVNIQKTVHNILYTGPQYTLYRSTLHLYMLTLQS